MAEPPSSIERFTDAEWAFLRHVRFGELPQRVRPEEMIELVECDPPPGLPSRPFELLPLTDGGTTGGDDGD